WSDLVDQFDRLVEMRVAGVRLAAQRVEDEDVQAFEQRMALGRDVAHVGEVGGGAEAVAGDGVAAVGDGDADKARTEEGYLDARLGRQAMKCHAGAGGVAV